MESETYQFGPAWEQEMNKHEKSIIIDFLRQAYLDKELLKLEKESIEAKNNPMLDVGASLMGGLGSMPGGHNISSQLKECMRVKIAWDYYNVYPEKNYTIPECFEMADDFMEGGKNASKDKVQLYRKFLKEHGLNGDFNIWKKELHK